MAAQDCLKEVRVNVYRVIALAACAAVGPAIAEQPTASTSHVYQTPQPLPFELNVDMVTWSELVANTTTKAILASVDPVLANSGADKYLGYYTIPQLRKFLPKTITPENIAKINAELAKLPRDQWPVQ